MDDEGERESKKCWNFAVGTKITTSPREAEGPVGGIYFLIAPTTPIADIIVYLQD